MAPRQLALLTQRGKAEQLAALLDGRRTAVQVAPAVAALGALANQLSAAPLRPRPEFSAALRDSLVQSAASTAAGTAAAGAGAAGSGAAGSGAGSGAGGSAGSTATSTTSTATSTASTATSTATSTASTAGSAAASSAAASTGAAGGAGAAGTSALKAALLGGKGLLPAFTPVVAGAMATAVTLSGVAVGASRSVPGDLFYGVKRGTESVQMALSIGKGAEARTRLGFAAARLEELTELIRRQDGGLIGTEVQARIDQLVGDWAADTAGAVGVLVEQARGGSREAIETLMSFTTSQRAQLAGVLSQLPDHAWRVATGGLAYLGQVDIAAISTDPFVLPTTIPVPDSVLGTVPLPGGGTGPGAAQTGTPTQAPTGGVPTGVPTTGPTGLPTGLPTQLPTGLPTGLPTELPTGLPTGLPTQLPTGLPTGVPTSLPTSVPTGLGGLLGGK